MIGIGIEAVIEAVHEFPRVDYRIRGEGIRVGEIDGVGGLGLDRRRPAGEVGLRRTVNQEEGAIGGGSERNEVVGVALFHRRVVDERRR